MDHNTLFDLPGLNPPNIAPPPSFSELLAQHRNHEPMEQNLELTPEELNALGVHHAMQNNWPHAIALWEKSASHGFEQATLNLAFALSTTRDGIDKDPSRAIQLLEELPNNGIALTILACLYDHEPFCDHKKSVELYQRAVEIGGFPMAFVNLAHAYTTGTVLAVDWKKFETYTHQAADWTVDYTCYENYSAPWFLDYIHRARLMAVNNLIAAYEDPKIPLTCSDSTMDDLHKLAAALGDITQIKCVAKEYASDHNYALMLSCYRRAAALEDISVDELLDRELTEDSSPSLLTWMSDCYFYGQQGLEKDTDAALRWFKKAACAPNHADMDNSVPLHHSW